MIVKYYTFENGKKTHSIKVEIDKSIDVDTIEGTQYLNRLVSDATGLSVGSFKVGNISPE